MTRFRKTALLALFVASPAIACSVLLDTSADQCQTDGDCQKRGGAFAQTTCVNKVCVSGEADATPQPEAGQDSGDAAPPDPTWGCLGHVVTPQPGMAKVNVKVPLIDLLTKTPVTDVTANVCAKIDINCAAPMGPFVPDMMGVLNLSLDQGFDGFVQVVPNLPDAGAPDGGDGGIDLRGYIVPSLIFFNPALVQDTTYITIVLVKLQTILSLTAANMIPFDPTLGAFFMETTDCQFKAAKDVVVALDSTGKDTSGFYFLGSLPSLTAAATDDTGYAGFINVPNGNRSVTATLSTTKQYIGKTSVFTKPGFISYTQVAPSQ